MAIRVFIQSKSHILVASVGKVPRLERKVASPWSLGFRLDNEGFGLGNGGKLLPNGVCYRHSAPHRRSLWCRFLGGSSVGSQRKGKKINS
jgi:hypothetical protein